MKVLERWEMTEEQRDAIDYAKRLEAAEIEMMCCVIENGKAFQADSSNWQAAHLKGQAESTLCNIRNELKAARRDMARLGISLV